MDKDIILLDCPGVVQSSDNSDSLILRNAIKVEALDDPIKPVELMLSKIEHPQLWKLYGITEF